MGERRPGKFQRHATKVEAMFLAMPPDQQVAAYEAIEAIASAVSGLRHLPDPLVDEIGRIVIDFLIETNLPMPGRPQPEQIVRQLLDGSPTLLGPHRAQIEAMIDAGIR